jgi:growth arrest-specific protein 8
LDLIHTLKEELHVLKRKEAADDKLMYDIAQENKRMTEPLKRALADIEQLTAEREAYR